MILCGRAEILRATAAKNLFHVAGITATNAGRFVWPRESLQAEPNIGNSETRIPKTRSAASRRSTILTLRSHRFPL